MECSSKKKTNCPKYYSNETFTKSDEKIPLTIPVALKLLKNWYREASYEAEDTLYDIKCIWNSTDGDFSKKISTTNRLFIYYLLILAIYIIHMCFLIDEKLFEGLCKILSSINAV